MEIYDHIEMLDLGLYLKDYGILAISDTQIGYEESLNKQGIMLPRFQHKDLMKRVKKLVEICRPGKIIINGDLKHEFGRVSGTEWRYTLELIDFLGEKAELVLVRGNHDKTLGPIAEKKNLEIVDYYVVGDIYFCHGHEIPENSDFKKAKAVIIGHEHPAIGLRENGRVERFKCFLRGKHKKKTLLVLPSFNLLTEGTDVLSEKLLSPFLKQNIKDFEVFVAADRIRSFGKIKELL